MTAQPFTLIPFAPLADRTTDLTISGTIARNANRLTLHYALHDPLALVAIPPAADPPQRTFALWEHTCFEFFLGESGCDRYWEFNLSPSGQWNIYRLESYRQGLQEELKLTPLPFTVQHFPQPGSPQTLALQLDLDLTPILPPHALLEVAITTVIQQQDGQMSYWALTHCAPEADFHQRQSFVIALPSSHQTLT
jgi:hypothetical protein